MPSNILPAAGVSGKTTLNAYIVIQQYLQHVYVNETPAHKEYSSQFTTDIMRWWYVPFLWCVDISRTSGILIRILRISSESIRKQLLRLWRARRVRPEYITQTEAQA